METVTAGNGPAPTFITSAGDCARLGTERKRNTPAGSWLLASCCSRRMAASKPNRRGSRRKRASGVMKAAAQVAS